MNILTISSIVLLCLVVAEARHFDAEDSDTQDGLQIQPEIRRRDGSGRRHRKRSFGYDYPHPRIPFYTERMDYNRNQDLLPEILRLLDEISMSLKRTPPPPPPQPPQPIYIPYPVLYPTNQKCSCNSHDAVPNITDRAKMDDVRQNWGVDAQPIEYEEEGDGSRPISLVPIAPLRPMSRPAPKVEHGSSQAGEYTTSAPQFLASESALSSASASSARSPGNCNAAILTCCGSQDISRQKQCFNSFGCLSTFAKGNICSKQSISDVLESFKMAYSPS